MKLALAIIGVALASSCPTAKPAANQSI